jgi:hypothetical protein
MSIGISFKLLLLEKMWPALLHPLAQVPLLWNRSVEAASSKVLLLSSELGVGPAAVVALLMAQPPLAAINLPGLVADKMSGLATALGVTDQQVRRGGGGD